MDKVDLMVEQWLKERPDLNVSSIEIYARLMIMNKLAEKVMGEFLKLHGLTNPEFDVLAVLRRIGSPYTLSAGELCDFALLSSGAMTNRIDRLEKKKLVQREVNPNDRRGVFVSLTSTGFELIDKIIAERFDVAENLVSSLSMQDRKQLNILLKKI